MVKRLPVWVWLAWVMASLPGGLAAAEIEVRSDRSDLHLNESFELVFEAKGGVDDEPDFTPLEEDFEILSQSQNQSLRIISGQTDREREWALTLMPRRAGELRIPSIAFGSDRSAALAVTVGPARSGATEADEDLYLEVETDTAQTWVQAEVVLTVRIYHAPELRGGRLGSPVLEGDDDAVIEVLGDDRSYHTQRNGRRYFVIERRYVVFPQTAGQHRFRPLNFQGQVIQPPSRFDPFRQRGRTVRLVSDAVPLEVRPIPAEFAGKPWLPARDLHLAEHWSQDPPQLTQGEPATRTLALIADGLLASQLPELTAPLPAALQQYPDQPRLETQEKDSGVIGLREEKHAVIANQPGRIELPGFAIDWFNTTTGEAQTARIEGRVLEVAAGSNPASGIAIAQPPPASAAPSTPASGASSSRFWPMLAAVLAGGWLATLLAWWWSARPLQAGSGEPGDSVAPSTAAALKALRRACTNAEPSAVERALIHWAGARWPGQTPRSLGAIARRVGPPAAGEIRQLEAVRYAAASASDWQPEALYAAIATWREAAAPGPSEAAKLAPLHPNLRG